MRSARVQMHGSTDSSPSFMIAVIKNPRACLCTCFPRLRATPDDDLHTRHRPVDILHRYSTTRKSQVPGPTSRRRAELKCGYRKVQSCKAHYVFRLPSSVAPHQDCSPKLPAGLCPTCSAAVRYGTVDMVENASWSHVSAAAATDGMGWWSLRRPTVSHIL